MITIDCNCGTRLRVQSVHAGKRLRCPNCAELIAIPDVAESEDDPQHEERYEEVAAEQLSAVEADDVPLSSGDEMTASSTVSTTGFRWRRAMGVVTILVAFGLAAGIVLLIVKRKRLPRNVLWLVVFLFGVGYSWWKGEVVRNE
ncbi:MAG: hypothetical protein ACK5Q5_08745 [Planctomycetaceae bacterium]